MTEAIVSAVVEEVTKKILREMGVGAAPTEESREKCYITKQRAAEMLDCTVRTVERYIESGELEKFRRGKHTVVLRWQVEQLVK